MTVKHKFFLFSIPFFVAGIFFAVEPAHASLQDELNKQTAAFAGEQNAGSNLGARDPREVAALIIASMLGVVGMLCVVYTVYAGYLIMTSAGNEDRIEKGKSILVNCVIGVALILSALGIARLVDKVLRGTEQGDYCKIEEDLSDYQNSDPLKNAGSDPGVATKIIWGDTGCIIE